MKKIIYILIIIFSFTFLLFGCLLIYNLYQSKNEKKANDILIEIVEKEIITEDENTIYTESGILKKYYKIYKKNQDVAGWIKIDGTKINYPVMYTPDDIEFYLRKDFNKKYAVSGSLFLGSEWNWNSNYSIIYGHNMNNGTMFGGLLKYRKKDYALKHSTIHFDTLYSTNDYEVMGAFYSEIFPENKKDVFRYYQYTNLGNKDIFDDFIKKAKLSFIYDTGITANYKDKILVLSTCSYHTKNGRFVVIARKKSK